MTKTEAVKMLTAKAECMTRDTSGMDEDCNSHRCGECNLCYEQGNMGEQVEYLQMAIKALEAQPKTGTWIHCGWAIACSECGYDMPWAVRNYCPNCGARMKDEGR